MASQFYPDDTIPPFNATAVAVEKDNKNSKAAVRWAIDNLMITNPFIILIHVRHKNYRREHKQQQQQRIGRLRCSQCFRSFPSILCSKSGN
ncbi:hypothetical protein F8388_014444 [Cannabis sativa]|uniref:Uncharacterized protein n=1 Tax=Cannabis sativa TaxID=3483 RepID=A0A7J6FB14_CANSA|nr:hypothetical protein G4B88_016771 [Cannabis sativa]KAF4375722.1 hypothetical protein F8388_014444 [Cannabis sativa]